MSWSFKRVTGNPFYGRFTLRTKVKRLEKIDEDDFDEVAGAQTGWKETTAFGRKLKKGSNYHVKEERHSNVVFAWKRALPSEPRKRNKNSEVSLSSSLTPGNKGGYIRSCLEKRSCYKKWNTTTGKEIKSESTQPAFSELFEARPSLFVNELALPTPATLYGGRLPVYRQSRDPALVIEEAKESSVPTNQVTLNVTAGNAWEETRNRTSIKSTLTKYFSRFKLEKKTKVRKVQI